MVKMPTSLLFITSSGFTFFVVNQQVKDVTVKLFGKSLSREIKYKSRCSVFEKQNAPKHVNSEILQKCFKHRNILSLRFDCEDIFVDLEKLITYQVLYQKYHNYVHYSMSKNLCLIPCERLMID